MMTKFQQDFLRCLRSSLFTGDPYTLSEAIVKEAKHQSVFSLIAIGTDTYSEVSRNVQIAYEQRLLGEILKPIPYVVLKGQAAAIYYLQPLRRALGDIDIIVRPEDFSAAYDTLKSNGYISTLPPEIEYIIDVPFTKNGILVELHKSYAMLNNKSQEMLLNQWIYDGILNHITATYNNQIFPMLTDSLNGLTLLAHISKHLESGLGFRQIIDWVMYVDKKLHDSDWPDFCEKTDQLGLTKLAKVSARLGQLYFGLPEKDITWCKDADESLCEELLAYVFECGNFGNKLGANNTVISVFSKGRSVKSLFFDLQRSGEITWKAYKKHHSLKPFAWFYQSFRLASKGLKKVTLRDVRKDYRESKRRNRLMERLEATQRSKRL